MVTAGRCSVLAVSVLLLVDVDGLVLTSARPAATLPAVRHASPLMKEQPAEPDKKPKMGIDLSGLTQLITMGAGAPGLGELKETNFKDPTKPDLVFELEANNFFDKKGDIKKGKYFESGWTDEAEEESGPGFWENLMSGGRLQREADARRRDRK